MLRVLHVKNMALIEEEKIEFGDGLNILTGETGAGKSILIGSLGVALGSGSFKDFVPENADHASVELIFDTQSGRVKVWLEEHDIPDMDGQIIISRSFRKGRSISRINGEVVPIGLVRELSSDLIDIHGQHEHQSLLYPKYHLQLVDDFAGEELEKKKERCRMLYQAYASASQKLKEALRDAGDRAKNMDFISFEVSEIDDAGLRLGEDEELENRFRFLSNAQKIMEALSVVQRLTDGDGETDASSQISRASGELSAVASYDEELMQLQSTLSDAEGMLSDFTRALSGYIDAFSYDEQEFSEVSDRLDLINHLKMKYGRTIEDILSYRDARQQELDRLSNFDAYVSGLKAEAEKSRKELLEVCGDITALRKTSAEKLTEQIVRSLRDLNFLDVRFEIHFEKLKEPSSNGMDEASFLISMNPGLPLRPLQHVASGGELSRIMLGIKTVMAKKDEIECLIFDEIDTGISGRTAQKVSEKMAQLSRDRQVIAITHLTQIASMADVHFLIEKHSEDGKTHTGVRQLTGEEITDELARILGGVQITDAVRATAAEMKRLADEKKNSY
ncbi:DNA repair protein RecN [Porcincola intestinalis]|uniref:DNA repair protein RecN n=1 Tax=Porcincola intestinalis TaxID=2606632 RepID=UPI0023F140DF|nr:DNA repair protein RecN [Porcincola intestinalis]MCI6768486.1 DNA repair protein RecN [Lachnospiraceae bacterium]MDD7060070.1 DNA repair protein RecN [Porcincola intestinalis]MDY5282749.1 DNA repair protein RecN [Porcincola intestinalis]